MAYSTAPAPTAHRLGAGDRRGAPRGSTNVLTQLPRQLLQPIAATKPLFQLLDDYRRSQIWRRIALIDCGEQWACSIPE